MYQLKEAILEVTNRCNLNCIFCGSDSKNQINPNELSILEWFEVVDELKELGAKKIILSGGEPMLKEWLPDLIAHIDSLGIKYGLISNGFCLPEDVFYAVKKYRPCGFGISIDGGPTTHDRLRGKKESFAKLLQTINRLKKEEIPLTVNTTVHKTNYQELPWLANALDLLGIRGWQIQLAMPFGRMKENQRLILSPEEFAWVCVFVAKARQSFPRITIAAADDFAYAPAGIIRDENWQGCSAGICSIGIDSLGNVKGCLSLTECPAEGNLRKKSLAEIWHDENSFVYNRKFTTENLPAWCRQCEKAEICRGGCNSQSYAMTGRFNSLPFCFWKTIMKERR